MKNQVAIKILQELLKNSKKSDRELAKVIGVSQATFTRRRKQLERKVIQEYTITPNLYELGFEILAFTFVSIKIAPSHVGRDLHEKGRRSMAKHSCVIFAYGGEGLGMSAVMVSVHKDYTSYSRFIIEFRQEWADILVDIESFLVSLKGEAEAKPFSLKPLADILPIVIEKKL